MDREDGEMSDDNAMLVDDVKEPISFTEDCTVVSKNISHLPTNCSLVAFNLFHYQSFYSIVIVRLFILPKYTYLKLFFFP